MSGFAERSVDLRGTRVSLALFLRILEALPRPEGRPVLRHAQFRDARFAGHASFGGAQFTGAASFHEAQFTGTASFVDAQFTGTASFVDAQFTGAVSFRNAQFTGDASFRDAHFTGGASFNDSQFTGTASFRRAEFTRDASFRRARFTGTASFRRAEFTGDARFDLAEFTGDARFDLAQFTGAASFAPVSVDGELSLNHANFSDAAPPPLIEVAASRLSCVATRFGGGAALRLRYADVVLDGVQLPHGSSVSYAPEFKGLNPVSGSYTTLDERRLKAARPDPRPRVISLRGADVSNLVLSDLDLADCLFQGTHRLEQLRIEGARPFAASPAAATSLRPGPVRLPLGRWSRRQALAEEHRWRASSRPWWDRPGWLKNPQYEWVEERSRHPIETLEPARLAAIYRALRKAHEDKNNEPGAADFYYGEMEMRRASQNTPWGERVILFLYWLTSGYGLRGMRALTCLTFLVLLAALGLRHFGLGEGSLSFTDAVIYTAQSTLSIQGDIGELTRWGELLRILLRIGGPLFLGLALLSVRNRVKR